MLKPSNLFNMNNKIENRLSMYRTVEKVCDKAESVLQGISGLWSNYQLFKTAVGELDEAIKGQLKELKGLAVAKTKAKERLVNGLLLMSNMAKAYAKETEDDELFSSLHITPSGLYNLRDEVLLDKARLIKDTVEQHSSHLSPFGFTISIWNDFLSALEDYSNKVEGPAEGVRMRVVLTKEIELIDKRIREILTDRLDTSMYVIGLTDPMTLKNYQSARVIINRMGRHKKAENIEMGTIGGFVRDENGEGIADAEVLIVGTSISMMTDEEGEYLIDTLPEGMYSIAVKAEGYSEGNENDIKLSSGEVLTLDFLLVASNE